VSAWGRAVAGTLVGTLSKIFVMTLACAALAACIVKPRLPDTQDADVYTRAGRFALRAESLDGAQQAVQGGFVWREAGRVLRLDLSNPLGTTLARVDASVNTNPAHAVLTRADGSQTVAPDADALLADALGSAIPVGSLRDWLHGRLGAQPVQNLTRDAEHRPETFTQDGWQVRLSRYDALGPRLLRLKREQAGELIDVRLVIDAEM